MDVDVIFHFPPELTTLLIDTIPVLVKAKKDVILFFKGAGVPWAMLDDVCKRVETDRQNINKYEIVRTVLTRLNERGDGSLRERREVVKRVVEWEEFSTCYQENILKAKGLVSDIRKIVNVKDSFTRMNLEREAAQRTHQAEAHGRAVAAQQRAAKLEAVKKEFYDLFALQDPKKRGKLLEGALHRVFEVAGILVTEAFAVVGSDGEGVVEQVDGAVEIEGKPYLVEMKWWNAPIGRDPMCSHLVRVYGRGGLAHGIFISYTDFTEPAITVCKDALGRGAVVALCTLAELVRALENRADLKVFFKDKIDAAIVRKMPYIAYQ
jgi:restriction system protein